MVSRNVFHCEYVEVLIIKKASLKAVTRKQPAYMCKVERSFEDWTRVASLNFQDSESDCKSLHTNFHTRTYCSADDHRDQISIILLEIKDKFPFMEAE